MKRTRSFRLLAAGVVVALTSAVAVSTTTQSASANDFQIIQDNLDDALGLLLDGWAGAAEVFLATQSVQDTAHALADALAAAGAALIAGTAQFGSLGLGLTFLNLALMANLDPFLAALDDPSLAADLFDPAELQTILDNLVPAITALVAGTGPGTGGVIASIASLLQGNILGDGLFGATSPGYFVGDILVGLVQALNLLDGGDFMGIVGNLNLGFVVIALVGAGALDGFAGAYINSLESALAGLLGGQLAVVVGPIVGVLTGFSLPALSLPFP